MNMTISRRVLFPFSYNRLPQGFKEIVSLGFMAKADYFFLLKP